MMRYVALLRLAPAVIVLAVTASILISFGGDDRLLQAAEPDGQSIDDLIEQLGSEQFSLREEASRLLKEREDAAPALRTALNSADPEVARRASRILDVFARRHVQREVDRFRALAKNGEVDLLAEWFARWRYEGYQEEEDACWQAITNLAGQLCRLEKQVLRLTHTSGVAYSG